MDNPALQKALDKAVLGLFSPNAYASTFLTTIYCSLRFQWSTKIRTACTNGIWLMINPDWFLTLSDGFRITLLSHELWHIAFMHMGRVGKRNFQLYNMAADHAINLMLMEHGYIFDRNPLNGDIVGLADPRFKGMSADQIYDILEKENPPIDLPFGDDFSDTGLDVEEDGSEPLTPSQINDIFGVLSRAVLTHEMSNSKEAGILPGEITAMMSKLLRPRLKFGTRLDRWLTAHDDVGSSWSRPNRRYEDIYMPSASSEGRLTRLLYAIDCSGSLTDDQLRVINSELKGVQNKYQPESMKVVSFDTMIHDVWEFSPEHPITELEIHGRGGTDMREVWDLIAKERPQALIMFSDMGCDIPGRPRGTQVLWVCLDNPKWKPPYGEVMHIDTSQDL